MTKFSAEVPKGDGWGIDEVVMDAVRAIQRGEKSPMIPVMGVIDIKEIKIDPETQNVIPVVRVRRLEALVTVDQIRNAQRLLMERWAERKGEGAVLPFENDDVLQRAFEGSGQAVGEALQDDEEQRIDADLNDTERLARHLIAVHDYDPKILHDDEMADADILRTHEQEHAKDPADRAFPDHDPGSVMWRRVDLKDMLGEAEEPTAVTETDQADGDSAPDVDEGAEGHRLIPEFWASGADDEDDPDE
jgi:hypothetical protein